jgi:hypothetical protein
MGLSAVTAYNLTLLATFPLAAMAAQWLAFTITRRHDAAILCGLAYGFCPYRIAHLQHLELLGGFGMPAALAALHRYRETSAWRWLAVLSGALVMQGLWTSYYLLFFSVLLALWVFWFIGWRDPRRLAAIGIACAIAAVALLPVIVGYERIHEWYGLKRRFSEVTLFSADVTGLGVASPLIALWGWTARWALPEGELFPGLTITTLALAAAALGWMREPVARDRVDRGIAWLPAVAAACAAISIAGWAFAPWHVSLPGLKISSDAPYKPFSLAVLAIAIWIGASSRMRSAYARRSPLAFYLVATAVLVLCALGPKPTLLGHQILYKPVYAWLMELPAFSSIRVPARFAMPAMLALSVAGAIAFSALAARPHRRPVLALLLMGGVIADSWIAPLPLLPLPDRWPTSQAAGFASVLELPLGTGFDDFAAMYRATVHQHRVVNGSSGFEPTHYFTLRMALEERDPATFDGFPPGAPILVVLDKRQDAAHEWQRFLTARPRISVLGGDERWEFFSAGAAPPAATVCSGEPVPIASATASGGGASLGALTDRNPSTWWATVHPQQVGDALTLDLGRRVRPCAAILSVGEFRASYPRKLVVETSENGDEWHTVATERTAGLTMRGAFNDPKTVPILIGLAPSTARFVRLRIDESHPSIPWMVTDVAIRAEPGAP